MELIVDGIGVGAVLSDDDGGVTGSELDVTELVADVLAVVVVVFIVDVNDNGTTLFPLLILSFTKSNKS